MKGDPILEAKGVTFCYPDGTRALEDVSVSIPKGKKTAFLGPNGAGKTTLFLHFNGILRPQQGEICFEGQPVRYDRASLLELRRKVGVVFQDPDTQLFSATVMQEISFGPLNLGLPEEEVWERVKEVMIATDVFHLKDRPTHFLSYGQKKRVALADILAMQPDVLICDEPTAWLDPQHSAQIMKLLDKINSKGITIVFSTHDVDLAYSWADYVVVVQGGKIVGEGTPEAIFRDHELLQAAALDRPWVLEVHQELCRKGWLFVGSPPRTKKDLFSLIRKNHPQDSQGGLRRGYTTGTCAAAAARAAVLVLQGQKLTSVEVKLPGGGVCELPIAGWERKGDQATAWVIKDAGDDPDVTNGARVQATVRLQPGEIVVRGGPGVGVVTKPGLAVPPGQPAINPVPLQMIRENVAAVLPPGAGAEVTISVPEGEKLARKTMNPQLGIVGGISILGTTGIVEPVSEKAFMQALVPQLKIAAAFGYDTVILTPGRQGKKLATKFLKVPPDAVVLMSNFVGFMLEKCVQLGFRQAVLWGHVGKLAKVAAGCFHTHNRISDGRTEVVAALAAARGADSSLIQKILAFPTVEGMVSILQEAGLQEVWSDLAARASQRAVAYTRQALRVGTVLLSVKEEILGWDDSAAEILEQAGWDGLRKRL